MITYAERIAAVKAENARAYPGNADALAWQKWAAESSQRLTQAEREHNRERLEWLRSIRP